MCPSCKGLKDPDKTCSNVMLTKGPLLCMRVCDSEMHVLTHAHDEKQSCVFTRIERLLFVLLHTTDRSGRFTSGNAVSPTHITVRIESGQASRSLM